MTHPRKTYTKPLIRLDREIEALTTMCIYGNGLGAGDEKLTFDPNTGACIVPIT